MRGLSTSRSDAVVAAFFVVAAAIEAVVVHHSSPGQLALGLLGAPVLAVLAVRRTRPVLCLGSVTAFAVGGTLAQVWLWPEANNSGGVWIFAMLLACYSLGAHARGVRLALGGVLPLLVVLAADVPTMTGWALANGMLFVTTFVGVLPTLVGRLVGVRRDRVERLARQRELILGEQQARRRSVAWDERLRATERLRPTLLDGLRGIAERAGAGADPAELEHSARTLLTRTREEVVALTSPVAAEVVGPVREPASSDHLAALRAGAQRWAVLGAGLIAATLTMETSYASRPDASEGVTLVAGILTGACFALLPWRPLTSVVLVWIVASAYSHQVAPLTGTISEPALALSTAFGVATLASRRVAIVGLLVCLVGQAVGVSSHDILGGGLLIVVAWLGGLAVQDATSLVEEGRANNRLLADQEAELAHRALVEERLRLARDVHDQIGHSLTVVALQAGAARRLGSEDPERSRQLLATIASAAHAGAEAVDSIDSAGLPRLLEHTAAAGVLVEADPTALDRLAPEQRTVAFRLIQEGLTNAMRHAPGAAVRIDVEPGTDAWEVRVRNTSPSGPSIGHGNGRGLTGLRERVEAIGGSVTWGRLDDGGFEVRGALPMLAGVPR